MAEPALQARANLMHPDKRSTTAAYYLAFVVLGLILAIVGPTLPYLAEQTGSQVSQISFL